MLNPGSEILVGLLCYMLAETIYNVAICLSEKEQQRLYIMLGEKIHSYSYKKTKKQQLLSDKEALEYLLKNLFQKKKGFK